MTKVVKKKRGRIVIISGPSGSGKTTLHNKLLASPAFKNVLIKSLSATTRKRREGERHGRDYIYLSEKMFKYKIRAGHFLEWQKVFDNYYGTPKKNVLDLLNQGKNVLLCIDVKGTKVVRRHFKKAILIFIKAPSLKVLEKRLSNRKTDDQETIDLRLKVAREEIKEAANYDHRLVNNNLAHCFSQLQAILVKELGLGA